MKAVLRSSKHVCAGISVSSVYGVVAVQIGNRTIESFFFFVWVMVLG